MGATVNLWSAARFWAGCVWIKAAGARNCEPREAAARGAKAVTGSTSGTE
jgi:hypothetical protein